MKNSEATREVCSIGSRPMKAKDWAVAKPDEVCTQGKQWRSQFGTYLQEGVEYCCSCGRRVDPTDSEAALADETRGSIPIEMLVTTQEVPGFRTEKSLGLIATMESGSGGALFAGGMGRIAGKYLFERFTAIAKERGANAVVAMAFLPFGSRGAIMSETGVLISGTAVLVSPLTREEPL